jgi:hypothetical protein
VTSETVDLDLGFVKEVSVIKGYWIHRGSVLENYQVMDNTVTDQTGTTHRVLTFAYQDPHRVCTRASAQAPWRCTPQQTQALMQKFLPFVRVSHVRVLAPRVVGGQRALGAVLTIQMNLAGAAAAGGASPGAAAASGGADSITATYWISAATFLPITMTISGFPSSQPTTVSYSDWNSPAVVIPHIP